MLGIILVKYLNCDVLSRDGSLDFLPSLDILVQIIANRNKIRLVPVNAMAVTDQILRQIRIA